MATASHLIDHHWLLAHHWLRAHHLLLAHQWPLARRMPPMPAAPTYRFGSFELRAGSRTLLRDGEPLAIVPRQAAILALLVSKAGLIVAKDEVMAAGWQGEVVGENSVDKAISELRRQLGERPEGGPYVETVRRRGFRFTAAVSRTEATGYATSLAPHLLGVEGRAAIETLSATKVAGARATFEDAVRCAPQHAPAHVGLATACAMQFEATRADPEPDYATLGRALRHALLACHLDPGYAEASATLAFVLSRAGHHLDAFIATHVEAIGEPFGGLTKTTAGAVAAARQATLLETGNWRHEVRLAAAAWGEEALGAIRRAVSRVTTFPLAHVLAARVHIARQTFAEAERELSAGIAADEAQRAAGAPFGGVGVHWLYGLLRLSAGDRAAAEAAFARELASEGDGHIYAREMAAHTWHATGALRLHAGDAAGAVEAFQAAIGRVPSHPLAHAGLVIARRRSGNNVSPLELPDAARGGPADLALARAALLVEAGQPAEGAALVAEAVAPPEAPSAGWILPVEPLLDVMRAPDVWRVALARLRGRAM
ncbi:MAG: transcriptional regulator [Acidobacteriota bacterium]